MDETLAAPMYLLAAAPLLSLAGVLVLAVRRSRESEPVLRALAWASGYAVIELFLQYYLPLLKGLPGGFELVAIIYWLTMWGAAVVLLMIGLMIALLVRSLVALVLRSATARRRGVMLELTSAAALGAAILYNELPKLETPLAEPVATRGAGPPAAPGGAPPPMYLRIVDQRNAPVPKASVTYSWGSHSTNFKAQGSDAYGLVALGFDDGGGGDISEIIVAGGYELLQWPLQISARQGPYGGGRMFTPRAVLRYARASPLLIRAWKLGENARLARGAAVLRLDSTARSTPRKRLTLRSDRNLECFRALPGEQRENGAIDARCEATQLWDDETPFDVEVRCDGLTAKRPTLRVRVPGGGALAACPLYPYEAPESGYSEDLSLDGGCQHGTVLFVRLADGKYGRLYVGTARVFEKSTWLGFEYAVNLDGGRSLETPRAEPYAYECARTMLASGDVTSVLP